MKLRYSTQTWLTLQDCLQNIQQLNKKKYNILRRFDDVESLKESKSLYGSIKNELTNNNQSVVTESMSKIEKSPSSGSAQNLIESKTYENPQFLRMKDIMSKIVK